MDPFGYTKEHIAYLIWHRKAVTAEVKRQHLSLFGFRGDHNRTLSTVLNKQTYRQLQWRDAAVAYDRAEIESGRADPRLRWRYEDIKFGPSREVRAYIKRRGLTAPPQPRPITRPRQPVVVDEPRVEHPPQPTRQYPAPSRHRPAPARYTRPLPPDEARAEPTQPRPATPVPPRVPATKPQPLRPTVGLYEAICDANWIAALPEDTRQGFLLNLATLEASDPDTFRGPLDQLVAADGTDFGAIARQALRDGLQSRTFKVDSAVVARSRIIAQDIVARSQDLIWRSKEERATPGTRRDGPVAARGTVASRSRPPGDRDGSPGHDAHALDRRVERPRPERADGTTPRQTGDGGRAGPF